MAWVIENKEITNTEFIELPEKAISNMDALEIQRYLLGQISHF